jgi:hypothetical protein
MAISRYRRNLAPVRSSYIEQPWIPDFQLLGDAISRQQNFMDEQRKMALIPTDGLTGKDADYAKEINNRRLGIIDKAAETYTDQGINAGNKYLRDMTMEIMREELPGGASYDLKERKKNYLEFAKKERERVQKGEIEQHQYWASVVRPLEEYNTDEAGGYKGGATLNLSSRAKSVDVDKLAKEYISTHPTWQKAWETGEIRTRNGKLIYRKDGIKQNDVKKIERELQSLLRQRMQETGELKDLFEYTKKYNPAAIKDETTLLSEKMQEYSNTETSINVLDGIDKNSSEIEIKQAQKVINSYLPEDQKITEDGVMGKQTRSMQKYLSEMLESKLESDAAKLRLANTEGVSALQYQEFANQYTKELAKPWAATKFGFEKTTDKKSLGSVWDEFDLWKAKYDYEKTGWLIDYEEHTAVDKSVGSGVDPMEKGGIQVKKGKDGFVLEISGKVSKAIQDKLNVDENGMPKNTPKLAESGATVFAAVAESDVISQAGAIEGGLVPETTPGDKPVGEGKELPLDGPMNPMQGVDATYKTPDIRQGYSRQELQMKMVTETPEYQLTKRALVAHGHLDPNASEEEEYQAVAESLYDQQTNKVKHAHNRALMTGEEYKGAPNEKKHYTDKHFNISFNQKGHTHVAVAGNREMFRSDGTPLLASELRDPHNFFNDESEERLGEEVIMASSPTVTHIVDTPLSTYEYNSLQAGWGDESLYISPSAGTRTKPIYLMNRLYAAKQMGAGEKVEFNTDGIPLGTKQLRKGTHRVMYDASNENFLLFTQDPDGEFKNTAIINVPEQQWGLMSNEYLQRAGIENVEKIPITMEFREVGEHFNYFEND